MQFDRPRKIEFFDNISVNCLPFQLQSVVQSAESASNKDLKIKHILLELENKWEKKLNTDPTKLKNIENIYCAVQNGFKIASSDFSLEKTAFLGHSCLFIGHC